MWDIYGERRNCHRKMDHEKFFSDRQMSQMSHQISQNVTLVVFLVRKMENGLWNIHLGPTLNTDQNATLFRQQLPSRNS